VALAHALHRSPPTPQVAETELTQRPVAVQHPKHVAGPHSGGGPSGIGPQATNVTTTPSTFHIPPPIGDARRDDLCWKVPSEILFRRARMLTAVALNVLLTASAPTTLSFSSDGTCGDERGIRDAITVRLGRDAFRDGTPGPSFVATITRQGASWTSALSVDGGAARKRTSSDCRELSQSLALAIALVLELAVTAPKAAPAPEPVVEPEPDGVRFTAGGAVFASAGASPHLTAGAAFAPGLRAGRFVLDVEARFDVPAATSLGGVTFRSFPVVLTVSPGFVVGPLRFAAPLSVGGLFVTGSSSGTSALFFAGLQVSGVIPIGNQWFLEPFLRAQASFIRVTVLAGTTPVWTTWPVVGLAGLSLRHEFLGAANNRRDPVPRVE
jgi:hypothetical protein